jgi:anti-sigma regulatory factor (Ser/Thr protein kinase)
VIPGGQEACNRQGARVELALRRGVEAPAIARAAVGELCQEAGLARARCQTLLLLVSEIVTNAVLHSNGPAATPIRLAVHATDDVVRVDVDDGGGGFTPGAAARARGGWGLRLVQKQASRWGVEDVRGTRVWFELALER